MKWEKENKIIAGLGRLYPEFVDWYGHTVRYVPCGEYAYNKAFWIFLLCKYHLNQRIPSLEIYIRNNCGSDYIWECYKGHFGLE